MRRLGVFFALGAVILDNGRSGILAHLISAFCVTMTNVSGSYMFLSKLLVIYTVPSARYVCSEFNLHPSAKVYGLKSRKY